MKSAVSTRRFQLRPNANNAVLVGEGDWNAIVETLYLSGVPGMRQSLLEGLAAAPEDIFPKEEFYTRLEKEIQK